MRKRGILNELNTLIDTVSGDDNVISIEERARLLLDCVLAMDTNGKIEYLGKQLPPREAILTVVASICLEAVAGNDVNSVH